MRIHFQGYYHDYRFTPSENCLNTRECQEVIESGEGGFGCCGGVSIGFVYVRTWQDKYNPSWAYSFGGDSLKSSHISCTEPYETRNQAVRAMVDTQRKLRKILDKKLSNWAENNRNNPFRLVK